MQSEWKVSYLKLFIQAKQVKGRYIGESFRTITDIMSFNKTQNIPRLSVFLDFERALDSTEWTYLQKCQETFNFGPQLRQSISVIYSDISSCILINGFVTKQFQVNLGRESSVWYPVYYWDIDLKFWLKPLEAQKI